jgi:hypothetical protein
MRERGKGRAERGNPGFKRSGLDGQLVRSDGGSNAGGFHTEREREGKVEETMLTSGPRRSVAGGEEGRA